MPRKITDKIFKQRVYNQVGNKYITLTPYVKEYEKVKFKHTKCNNTFWMTPNHFLVDHRRCSYLVEVKFMSVINSGQKARNRIAKIIRL